MKSWLVVGKTGGLGSSCIEVLESRNQKVVAVSRQDLDLSDFPSVMNFDLSGFDVVINCTGHNKGTFRGFLNNDYLNIVDQIQVNFIANLLLLKNYANHRTNGHYAWLNSISTRNPTSYQSIYGSTKVASKFAIDLIKQEASHINITECCVGLVKTNLRHTGYCGTKSKDTVDQEHAKLNSLDPREVAKKIIDAVEVGKEWIHIE